MKERKKGTMPLLSLTILLTLAGISTLLPYAPASKVNLLGYKSFAPMRR